MSFTKPWGRITYNQRKLGKPYFMCFSALLYAILHSIRIGFEGSKLKIVDQKASDGRVSQSGFQFLRWLYVVSMTHGLNGFGLAFERAAQNQSPAAEVSDRSTSRKELEKRAKEVAAARPLCAQPSQRTIKGAVERCRKQCVRQSEVGVERLSLALINE